MRGMTLAAFEGILRKEGLLVESVGGSDQKVEIKHLTCDSRQVSKGTLFLCKGAAFKPAYLQAAVADGAVAYISEEEYNLKTEVPHLRVRSMRKAIPLLAGAFFEHPEKELKLIGVTGTKGKTTTAYFIKAILDEYLKAQGSRESGILSTIDTYDGISRQESMLTTPEPVELLWHLKNAKDTGIEHMTMEVSSQGLKYHRVRNLEFAVGVFLNIAEDHISPIEHENFEDYFNAKLSMFKQTKVACVNLDADHAKEIVKAARVAKETVTFGTEGNPDIKGYNIRMHRGRPCFSVKGKGLSGDFILAMRGKFNIENALAAIAVTHSMGIPQEYMVLGLAKAKVAGRMEQYESSDGKATVIVDFAHNRLSFEKVFDSVLTEYRGRKIITIFGCPGGKAYNRRKELGLLAGLYSDKLYLVPDDPGMEAPEDIAAEIGSYAEIVGCPHTYYADRGQAIMAALSGIGQREEVLILVLGKGNERRQKCGNTIQPYLSDGEYVNRGIKEYEKNHFSVSIAKAKGIIGTNRNTVYGSR